MAITFAPYAAGRQNPSTIAATFCGWSFPAQLDAGLVSEQALRHHINRIARARCFPPQMSGHLFSVFNTSWAWGRRKSRPVIQLGN
ncbi:hypothetical protein KIF59_03270 [Enterobacter cloacae subsp. cloacae]|nr:hypothetical protein [Enterobacter cloacae subsp. cloacae]